MSDIKIKGGAELQRFLDQLPAKIEKNVARGAMRAAASHVLPFARGNINHVSGATAKSMKVGTRTRGGSVVAYIAVKSPVGIWLEYGTQPHRIEAREGSALSVGGQAFGSVDHPGARPHPFLRPALDAQAGAAVLAAARYTKHRLETKHGLDTADIEIGEVGE